MQRQAESQAAYLHRGRGGILLTRMDGSAGASDFGALDRKALEDANVAVTYAEGSALVADHGFTTGHIGQTSFEKLLSPSAMKIGVVHGIQCYADKLPEDERTKAVIPDQFRHEIATAFNLKGRGLIVLTYCSHCGVINAIKSDKPRRLRASIKFMQ